MLNVGLPLIVEAVPRDVTQLDWRPPAFGDPAAARHGRPGRRADAAANAAASPRCTLCARAGRCPPGPGGDRRAGRPERSCTPGRRSSGPRMCGPMRGALIGATLFEGWAATTGGGRAVLAAGDDRVAPCHHHGAVGPMAGVVSPSMPVWSSTTRTAPRHAFATLNEGLGKVLRFGAYEPRSSPACVDARRARPRPRRGAVQVRPDRRGRPDQPGAGDGRRGPQPATWPPPRCSPAGSPRPRPPSTARSVLRVPRRQRPLRAQPVDGCRQAGHGRRRSGCRARRWSRRWPATAWSSGSGSRHRGPLVHRAGRPGRRLVLPRLQHRRRQPGPRRLGDHRDPRPRRFAMAAEPGDHEVRRRHAGRRTGHDPRGCAESPWRRTPRSRCLR